MRKIPQSVDDKRRGGQDERADPGNGNLRKSSVQGIKTHASQESGVDTQAAGADGKRISEEKKRARGNLMTDRSESGIGEEA